MKIMIKYKLFIAMLAATGAVVISMFLIMQWSIGRGFLAYVNMIEQERFERAAEMLEQSYKTRGNWDFVREDRGAWFRLLASTQQQREPGELERRERQERHQQQLEAPQPERHLAKQLRFPGLSSAGRPLPHRFEARVFLLDPQKRPVAGHPADLDQVALRPLRSGGHPVGYLGMRPRLRLTDTHQLLFVKQQKLAMALIAAVMLLISAAISLPLANRLVLPIRRLAASMHRLATGRFETRVPVGPEDELGQLSRDFNTLALTLEKNEQTRRRYVADISHELRTPLSILRGEIEAMQDGVRQAGPESLRSLHAEVMQLSRLVDDLYQISLSDIGALSYRKSMLDLQGLLEDELDSFLPKFKEKGIALETALPADQDFPMFGDPVRLTQLFDNLLDNALKYTDRGGMLSARLERHGERAELVFSDSAPGVPPDDLERLFERLYRVDSSRNRATGGAGLGLAICKNIVEAHEGSIRALPSPMGGILISIELPLSGSKA